MIHGKFVGFSNGSPPITPLVFPVGAKSADVGCVYEIATSTAAEMTHVAQAQSVDA
jgi:hypothetical protein